MKTSKKAKYPTLQIVEGYREGGKVKQRTVAHLGVIKSKQDLKRLKSLADKLICRLEQEGLEADPKVELKSLQHKQTVFDGFRAVVGCMLDKIGLSPLLTNAQGKHQFDLLEVITLILIQRFHQPGSKRRTFERQAEHGFDGIEIQHLYRAMDALSSIEEEIQMQIFDFVSQLTDETLDCVFFDVTTLYFESVSQDDLRDFGFSKDQKFHSVQIVLALVVDKHGLPITYELFNGNLAETNTLIPVLERLRERFKIKNVTVVCDRGLSSKANISALQESNFNFVIASKLRSMSSKLQLHDLATLEDLPGQKDIPAEERIRFRTMQHPQFKKTQLIITYSPHRALKDASDRNRLLENLQKHLSKNESSVKKTISNAGYKKFTKVKKGSLVEINEDAITEDEKWDGFHGIAVSDSALLTANQALARYKELWRIEEAFRVAKCTLKTRPIFHWKPDRIKSHVLLCYINLFMERYLEYTLRLNEESLTPDKIRYALGEVNTTIFEDLSTKREAKMESQLTEDAIKIYKALGLSLERGTTLNS